MKILVVDDEPLARQRLLRLLKKLRPEAGCFEAANGVEAIAQARAQEPEIILLDIRMPEMDGVEVAGQLLDEPAAPAVIFCTAYDEYALEALRNHAIAYLLKPVREAELEGALQAAVRVNRAQLDSLGVAGAGREEVVSAGHRGVEALPVAEVRCFLAEDKYVRACSPSGDILLNDSLKDLELEFKTRFLRVHRNALVAGAHIARLIRSDEGWLVELTDVAERPQVSRRHLSDVKALLTG
ncbi:LytTR family DNA-binding domain-containing protein [Congregibacter brevis]|uniref:LytTR family DNA-binding domain-containing protein n=1 Tax=Congregibacter brevis TaxID=3081201 RepID=A0ABZ0IE83_9GAMM|nr:LytTR family DNA-binding domain-containing protein [Congregibacter sp. IMCC45268]